MVWKLKIKTKGGNWKVVPKKFKTKKEARGHITRNWSKKYKDIWDYRYVNSSGYRPRQRSFMDYL